MQTPISPHSSARPEVVGTANWGGTSRAAADPSLRPMSAARDARREAMILEHQQLARALARRYANRGEPVDDLEQVAMIGLIKAVDRFDGNKGADFHAFATPTILGEIRRHFRDKTWPIHVPRGLKDNIAVVSSATTTLTNRLGRSPTIAEIAVEASMTNDQVLDALAAHSAYRPNSLAQSPGSDEDDVDIEIPVEEIGYHIAEGRTALREGLARLPARERLILHLRFDQGMIQSDIAKIVGVSQMHVSRLIARALETLRRIAEEGDL
jgi:RNA polymerase sigma-B factor